ncbi:MAG: acyl-CoA dehydrogenase family protein [Gammaproteobacteria bacterium]|nr:acyl-CoA dehydrogenase family protein [Gammaproteobacteria bacterium]
MTYIELTEEEKAFQTNIEAFVGKEVRPHVLEWEKKGTIPRTLWKTLGKLGFLGIRYPEECGGAGASYIYTYLFFKTLGGCGSSGVALNISVVSEMCAPALVKYGNTFLRENFLLPAFRGEKVGAIAITEPRCGSNVAGIQTRATLEGNFYRLAGQKTFITNGTQADFLTLLARTREKVGHQSFSLFVIPTETKGVSIGRALDKTCYPSSDTAEIFLDDVLLGKEFLIGEEGKGFTYQMEQFQWERLVGVILGLGAMKRVYELTKKYIGEREVFGKPLVSFQVTQHKMAQMCAEIALIEAMTELCVQKAVKAQDFTKEVSMLKLMTAQIQMKVMEECVQLHGGNGLMTEYEVARYFRDAKLMSIGGGSNEVMKEIIIKCEGLANVG